MSVKFTFATRVKPISSAHSASASTSSSKSTTSTHRSVNNGSSMEQPNVNISPPKIHSMVFKVFFFSFENIVCLLFLWQLLFVTVSRLSFQCQIITLKKPTYITPALWNLETYAQKDYCSFASSGTKFQNLLFVLCYITSWYYNFNLTHIHPTYF